MSGISRRQFVHTTAAAAGVGLLTQFDKSAAAARSIPTRPFGTTGVEVSAVGFGGGGRFFEPVPTDEAGAELVRQAIDRGIRFIETAANYGPATDPNCAERRIGLAMRTHRARAFLETKTDARDYDGAMREMERSLTLLQTDRVDLMLMHFMASEGDLERAAAAGGADKAIRKMVDQRVVRFRGVSTHSPALALKMIERLEPQAIQLPINATGVPDFEAEVLPLAQSKGIAVIAMKTCGHGFFRKEALGGAYDSRFLSDRDPSQHRFAPPEDAFTRPHPTPEQFTRYALSLPIATAVIGVDSAATIDAIVAAGVKGPLGAAEKQAVHERAQVFAATGYWIPRGSRS